MQLYLSELSSCVCDDLKLLIVQFQEMHCKYFSSLLIILMMLYIQPPCQLYRIPRKPTCHNIIILTSEEEEEEEFSLGWEIPGCP